MWSALVLYEYLVSLGEEIEVFWRNFKFTSVSVVFISTRFTLVTGVVIPFLWHPDTSEVSYDSASYAHHLIRSICCCRGRSMFLLVILWSYKGNLRSTVAMPRQLLVLYILLLASRRLHVSTSGCYRMLCSVLTKMHRPRQWYYHYESSRLVITLSYLLLHCCFFLFLLGRILWVFDFRQWLFINSDVSTGMLEISTHIQQWQAVTRMCASHRKSTLCEYTEYYCRSHHSMLNDIQLWVRQFNFMFRLSNSLRVLQCSMLPVGPYSWRMSLFWL